MKYKILVVEDDQDIRELICNCLQEIEGVEYTDVADGVEAVVEIKKAQFSLILTDYKMEKMNGLDFILNLRSMGLSTPVIMITGYVDSLSKFIDLDQNTAVLPKPFDAKSLVSVVKNMLYTETEVTPKGIVLVEPSRVHMLMMKLLIKNQDNRTYSLLVIPAKQFHFVGTI